MINFSLRRINLCQSVKFLNEANGEPVLVYMTYLEEVTKA